MDFKTKGLTVGELSMTIGSLLIVGLIWTSIKNNDNSKTSKIDLHQHYSLSQNKFIS